MMQWTRGAGACGRERESGQVGSSWTENRGLGGNAGKEL